MFQKGSSTGILEVETCEVSLGNPLGTRSPHLVCCSGGLRTTYLCGLSLTLCGVRCLAILGSLRTSRKFLSVIHRNRTGSTGCFGVGLTSGDTVRKVVLGRTCSSSLSLLGLLSHLLSLATSSLLLPTHSSRLSLSLFRVERASLLEILSTCCGFLEGFLRLLLTTFRDECCGVSLRCCSVEAY